MRPVPAVPARPTGAMLVIPVSGIGEITPKTDLGRTITESVLLAEDDVVVVTQKIVSKAEGRMVSVDPDDPAAKRALVERESVRVLRRRGELIISETCQGFICANAGVDLSNVPQGTGRIASAGRGPLCSTIE